MLSVSRLISGRAEPGDALRYRAGERRPVVVLNLTRACNLRCVHCYATATPGPAADELGPDELRAVIADLADYGVPALLLSGGEPLMRDDLEAVAAFAVEKGLRVAVSTNGTLIDAERARRLAGAGVVYVGVSLDGIGETNDRFRGVEGAYERALAGVEAARAAGLRVGVRFTMTRANVEQVPAVIELVRERGIPRLCFYHLVPSGRGGEPAVGGLARERTRATLAAIFSACEAERDAAAGREILTVDNHSDGPFLYRWLQRRDAERAACALALLERNGGNASGEAIACIDWRGRVMPDQFWRGAVVGCVRERPFSAIWRDVSGLLGQLRRRDELIHGRCCVKNCRFYRLCRGNMRARAEAAGDRWGADPACVLNDDEIAGDPVGGR